MIAGTLKSSPSKPIDVGVQRQQAVLPVDRAQDPFALGHLQDADAGVAIGRLERQLLVAAR